MRSGVLWYYGGTAFYAYNNAILLQIDEMPCENVGLGGRRYAHHSVDIPGYRFIGSRDGIVSSGSKCLYSLGTALPITCLRCSLSLPTPALIRSWHALRTAPGLLCGVGPRVGTLKPTLPLRRRRHSLATLRVLDTKRYADRPAVAPSPACANLRRFSRVFFKGSRLKDHGRGPPALG
jgi:hypothetical protein